MDNVTFVVPCLTEPFWTVIITNTYEIFTSIGCVIHGNYRIIFTENISHLELLCQGRCLMLAACQTRLTMSIGWGSNMYTITCFVVVFQSAPKSTENQTTKRIKHYAEPHGRIRSHSSLDRATIEICMLNAQHTPTAGLGKPNSTMISHACLFSYDPFSSFSSFNFIMATF
jgi:hypothetical protein